MCRGEIYAELSNFGFRFKDCNIWDIGNQQSNNEFITYDIFCINVYIFGHFEPYFQMWRLYQLMGSPCACLMRTIPITDITCTWKHIQLHSHLSDRFCFRFEDSISWDCSCAHVQWEPIWKPWDYIHMEPWWTERVLVTCSPDILGWGIRWATPRPGTRRTSTESEC